MFTRAIYLCPRYVVRVDSVTHSFYTYIIKWSHKMDRTALVSHFVAWNMLHGVGQGTV